MREAQILIASDLDRTLIPNGEESESPGARRLFRELRDASPHILAYVSGRNLNLVLQAIADYDLPVPDFIAADVGSTLYQRHDGAWRILPGWRERLAAGFPNAMKSRIAALLDKEGVQIQDQEHQSEFKLSFKLDAAAGIGTLETMIHRVCDPSSIRLIFSHDPIEDVGLLDILPVQAGKYESLAFLRLYLGLEPEQVLFAGDSGNDLDALCSQFRTVLVANALPEVRNKVGGSPNTYLAKGGFLGMNGFYAAGILEGFAHHFPQAWKAFQRHVPRFTLFGEVLFDCFDHGAKTLGGAPFNVAWHLKGFGYDPFLISRVGRDPEGQEIRRRFTDWGLDISGIQVDPQRPTGRVEIRTGADGHDFDIHPGQAWDGIQSEAIPFSPRIFYHGSLATRSECAHAALKQLSPGCRVFVDLNLRDPWWELSRVHDLVGGATWLKINDEELQALQIPGSTQLQKLQWLLKLERLEIVFLTLGAKGALAMDQSLEPIQVGPPNASLPVRDTVGAGDAFSAVCLIGLDRGWPLPIIVERAQTFASLLISHVGAILQDRKPYCRLAKEWKI